MFVLYWVSFKGSTLLLLFSSLTLFYSCTYLFRTFKKADLSCIKRVYPEAFTFWQEIRMYGTQKYELTIEVGQAHESYDLKMLSRRKEEFRRQLTCIVVQHHKVRGWVGEIDSEGEEAKKIEERMVFF